MIFVALKRVSIRMGKIYFCKRLVCIFVSKRFNMFSQSPDWNLTALYHLIAILEDVSREIGIWSYEENGNCLVSKKSMESIFGETESIPLKYHKKLGFINWGNSLSLLGRYSLRFHVEEKSPSDVKYTSTEK